MACSLSRLVHLAKPNLLTQMKRRWKEISMEPYVTQETISAKGKNGWNTFLRSIHTLCTSAGIKPTFW